MREIVFVTFHGVQILDVAGPLDAFTTANYALGEKRKKPLYRVRAVSRSGGEVQTSSGLPILTEKMEELSSRVDTVITVGGPGVFDAMRDERLISWLKAKASLSRRVCSVCTGAFLLGGAGLLKHKRATTHWLFADQLGATFPDISIEPDRIFTRDGNVWTSAGVSAGIDLSLALIEDDLGRDIAMRTARLLVMFLKRPGGQAQFSHQLKLQTNSGKFGELHEWIRSNLAADLKVDRLAERAGMTPRTFARVYVEKVGQTPAKTVELMRLDAARQALEDNEASIKQIARDSGFGDDERLRRSFLRNVGISPFEYRERFSAEKSPINTY